MFVVLLKFSDNRMSAGQFMAEHKQWIQQGIEQGFFQLVGSLKPEQGGAIIAHGIERPALEEYVAQDPFVEHGVVRAELLEISPALASDELSFMLAK